MAFILLDFPEDWTNLLPITYTRPVSEIRTGILTIRQKWEKYLKHDFYYYTQDYLQEKFHLKTEANNFVLNSTVLPDELLVRAIMMLNKGQALFGKHGFIAAYSEADLTGLKNKNFDELVRVDYEYDYLTVKHVWDIFRNNDKEIEKDFKLLTKNRESQPLSPTNTVFDKERIFVEEGAKIEAAILNPDGGYIYIGKNAVIMEGSIVRGSLAMCEGAQLKLGAKIYGATTLGPYCKVGGEVSNSVLTGYSNKAHDGFLGNAVLGEWCNLGAGTNNSNLKNNYSEVKIWNYNEEHFVKTGLQFCGLIMGDHSKAGINTMFNTGTVVGVSCNIFGDGFPRNFIPSFSWGGASGFTEYKPEKAFATAELVMKRRNKVFDEKERKILQNVYEMSKKYRLS